MKAVSIKHGNGVFKGLSPLGEGVADKATERRESSCWQKDSWSELAWERGEVFPLLDLKG